MPSAQHLAHLVLSHLLAIVSCVLAIVLVARAESQRRPTGSTMAWLLAIVFVPYAGIPVYLAIGRRKLSRRAPEKEMLGPQLAPCPTDDAAAASTEARSAPQLAPPSSTISCGRESAPISSSNGRQ